MSEKDEELLKNIPTKTSKEITLDETDPASEEEIKEHLIEIKHLRTNKISENKYQIIFQEEEPEIEIELVTVGKGK